MAVYAIGDIQGCFDPLRALLDRIGFDPAADRLWFTGDLVNRGPKSLDVLRFVRSLGDRAQVVLGNHDLHLLAVWCGFGRLKPQDSLEHVLRAEDADELLHWLRRRPVLHEEPALGRTLVHAGIAPAWGLSEARRYARELEDALRGPGYMELFRHIYGDQPDRWDDRLTGWDRLRYIVNAFTRMRFCAPDGRLLLDYKGPPREAPTGYLPWFDVPDRPLEDQDVQVVFGHWSTLGLVRRGDVLALDTGCLWGGRLTAVRLDGAEEITTIGCETALEPGPGR